MPPARIPGYQPRLLDELGALGEVAWIGCGPLGRDDGRIALFRPGRGDVQRAALAASRSAAPDRPSGPRHAAIRDFLAVRGASFYREVFVAAGGGTDRQVLDALWDLAWAGEVTNDTFAPLRALRWKRPGADRRSRPGRLATLGPPEAAGRWSRVEPVEPVGAAGRIGQSVAAADGTAAPSATQRLHALALALLDRHGVLTREAVISEGIEGGFAAIYPVLRALEEAGRIRRGYFIEGLGASQFALAGAIDRLRAVRDPDSAAPRVDLLAAADPAQPYGATVAWPRRDASDRRPFQRAAGAYVALVDGAPVLYLERGGHGLVMLPAADDPERLGRALAALRVLLADGRLRELVVSRVDGEPVGPASAWRDRLVAGGFAAGYRGMVLRASSSQEEPRARG